jgi:phenylacetate-coenzyme A ligase PaaK-like adenylate-forming protein
MHYANDWPCKLRGFALNISLAVAENQPSKNRVSTTSFSEFTARLREFIRCSSSSSFESLALDLFRLQFEHNRVYRNICESKQLTPETIDRWSNIPSLPTAAFKELDLTCLAPDECTALFHSSGTTGQARSRHVHSSESLRIYEASVLGWFAESVLRNASQMNFQMLFLTPASPQAPNSSLVYMFDTIRCEYGAVDSAFYGVVTAGGDWMLDPEQLIERLRKSSSDSRPVFLMGTGFSFVHLLDALAERQLQLSLPPNSMLLETGGYKGRSRELPKSELHRLLSKRLGLPLKAVICEYGMSELSSQAYTSPLAPRPSHLFHFPPWARVQMISPETGHEVNDGETGLIRVFDLANVYSVMAVQTEDLGIKRGDGFELLGRAALSEPRGCSLMAVEPNVS